MSRKHVAADGGTLVGTLRRNVNDTSMDIW